ncbi:MAG: hypothetical protein K2G32_08720 [Oscillospiraceae bacterium]|nr:hypothetical protein [Oscillospiraceae bacterium]
MTPEDIINYCLDTLDGSVLTESWGEKGIFYNPKGLLKRGVYILTVKEKDGENDRGSDLNRQGVFRVNIGVRKKTFSAMFGDIPKRPQKGGVVEMDCDFTETDKILPHPVYAWMSWICAINPSEKTFEQLKPLIREAYELAKEKYAKRKDIDQ